MPQEVGLLGVIGFIFQFAIMFFQEYLKLNDANSKAKSDAEKAQITYDGIAAVVLAQMRAANKIEKATDDKLQDGLDQALKGSSSGTSAPAAPAQQTTSGTPPGSLTK